MSTYGKERRQMREAFHRQSVSGASNLSIDFGNPLNMSTEEGERKQVFINKLNRLDKGHLARTIEGVILKRHTKRKDWKPPSLGFKATDYNP
tara:strand:+ start:695 stop:970 length:276 start_codon:yes stop_codon:yes gene_type:complete